MKRQLRSCFWGGAGGSAGLEPLLMLITLNPPASGPCCLHSVQLPDNTIPCELYLQRMCLSQPRVRHRMVIDLLPACFGHHPDDQFVSCSPRCHCYVSKNLLEQDFELDHLTFISRCPD